jgi:hypothetical protein
MDFSTKKKPFFESKRILFKKTCAYLKILQPFLRTRSSFPAKNAPSSVYVIRTSVIPSTSLGWTWRSYKSRGSSSSSGCPSMAQINSMPVVSLELALTHNANCDSQQVRLVKIICILNGILSFGGGNLGLGWLFYSWDISNVRGASIPSPYYNNYTCSFTRDST